LLKLRKNSIFNLDPTLLMQKDKKPSFIEEFEELMEKRAKSREKDLNSPIKQLKLALKKPKITLK